MKTYEYNAYPRVHLKRHSVDHFVLRINQNYAASFFYADGTVKFIYVDINIATFATYTLSDIGMQNFLTDVWQYAQKFNRQEKENPRPLDKLHSPA